MEKEVFAVSDVYDHAASIGKDIEQIVQEYGKESIEGKNIIHLNIFLPLSCVSFLQEKWFLDKWFQTKNYKL